VREYFENAEQGTRYYVVKLQKLVAAMESALEKGEPPERVAKSRRDFEDASGAYFENDVHLFVPAWDAFSPTYLDVWGESDNQPLNRAKYLPAKRF
jgi:hypothetical protein